MNRWWSLHTHSKYSTQDALPSVSDMVARAKELDYPALGLTDHGTLGGIAQLYRGCRNADILPFPGIEAYVHVDRYAPAKMQSRYHACIVAATSVGWRNLIGLNNTAVRQSQSGKPVIDFDNFASLGDAGLLDGLWITTGCWFGIVASALRSPDPTSANNIIASLVNSFSSRVLVELQNHHIIDDSHDDVLHNKVLARLAAVHGLPVVTTSDSHYIHPGDAANHNTLKRLVSFSDDVEDAVFPGDGYWMPSHDEMAARFDPSVFAESVNTLTMLTNSHDLKVPELDTFTVQVPRVTKLDPDVALRSRCEQAIAERGLSAAYTKQLDDELAVITSAGFSSYMLLVAQLTDWMRSVDIFFTARGSASGSLVCWLLGITDINPLKPVPHASYTLRFDRFLSGDRLKPPDIDLDIDQERRAEVLTWLGEQFSMMHIGLYTKMGLNADNKGSLLVRWKTMARKTGLWNPDDAPPADEIGKLRALSGYKALSNLGVHPAGVVVVSDESQLDRIPKSYVTSSDTFVTAFDGADIESMGYVKIDVLGVAALSAIRRALISAGLTLDDLPLTTYSDPAVYRRIARGNTHSLFQLGGYAARRGCRDLRPTKFSDLVAAMALFRPAMMGASQVGDFIARRHGEAAVPTRHRLLAAATADTYGVMLYQEQVLQVLRGIGMDADALTKTLKAIKSSNANTAAARDHMNTITTKVADMCRDAGMDNLDTEFFLEALKGYSDYGFNLSHAVAYARVAFITAWLATHHPAHWWAAELATCNADDVAQSRAAAVAAKVSIARPHVNTSGISWKASTTEPNTIVRGLSDIKGLGEKAATDLVTARQTGGEFRSIDDLLERTNSRIVTGGREWARHHDLSRTNGVLRTLYAANALSGLK